MFHGYDYVWHKPRTKVMHLAQFKISSLRSRHLNKSHLLFQDQQLIIQFQQNHFILPRESAFLRGLGGHSLHGALQNVPQGHAR